MRKKYIGLLCAILMVIGICVGCGSGEPEVTEEDYSSEELDDAPAQQLPKIGVSYGALTEFDTTFIEELKNQATANSFDVIDKNANGSAEQQSADIIEMLEDENLVAMVVSPVDIDQLESAMEQCEIKKIPVINVLQPINGVVNMLICPDYSELGIKGAKLCNEVVLDNDLTSASVFALFGPSDSFIMQMMYDGFAQQIGEYDTISVAGVNHCDYTEEQAYEMAKEFLSENSANIVFTQNTIIANGVEKALAELNQKAYIINIGGEQTVLEKVKSKEYYATMFVSPYELAEKTVSEIAKANQDTSYVFPEYESLEINVASESSIDNYLSQGKAYGDIYVEPQESPAATPSPSASESAPGAAPSSSTSAPAASASPAQS